MVLVANLEKMIFKRIGREYLKAHSVNTENHIQDKKSNASGRISKASSIWQVAESNIAMIISITQKNHLLKKIH